MSGVARRPFLLTLVSIICAVILLAAAPAPADVAGDPADVIRERLEALEFFLGEWELESFGRRPDGSVEKTLARSSVRRVLDGTALLDDFRALDDEGRVVFRGTSFRTWMPSKNAYAITWIMVGVPGITEIEARMVDGELVATGTGSDPGGEFLERFRYTDITKESYTFKMDRSYDGGEFWIEDFNVIKATRVPAKTK